MQLILLKKSVDTVDRTYYVDEGAVITENYNETLDSATVRISHLSSKLNIEPFDKVILRDENERFDDKYMCVDTYTETIESLDPYIYTYNIDLFSETKELESVILPNLSITQLTKTTKRTVNDYLARYINLYCPRVRTATQFVPKYSYDTDNYNFSIFDVECPEMQWNAPTLREVLTTLMMVVDCIPVMKNNKIGYINLTKVNPDISQNGHINYVQRSQSSEDYVSELKMNMVNVMQTSLEGVKQTVNRIEHMTFRTEDDGYVLTDQNYCLKTQFPILRVKHLWMEFEIGIQDGLSSDGAGSNGHQFIRVYKVDLCNLQLTDGSIKQILYEQTEYNSLPLVIVNPGNFNTISQNVAIYYQRYNNLISGFTQSSKRNWVWSGKISTLNILKSIIPLYCYDIDGFKITDEEKQIVQTSSFLTYPNTYFSVFFTIEYETTADAVFQAGKKQAQTHERVVNDNQTFSFVDSYNQGFMEYQKANRLGNQMLHINSRFEDDYSNMIKIGDKFEDSIIYQCQYQIYDNHIEINSTATKDYVLRDYFTGVKARIRAWNYAPAGESFTRHDLDKKYLELSKSIKSEIGESALFANYFLTPLKPTYIRPLIYSFVKTEQYPTTQTNYFAIDLSGRIIGNSLVFTFGFDDNFNVAKRVSKELQTSNIHAHINNNSAIVTYLYDVNFTNKYGGIPLEDTKYVDGNGEFSTLFYELTYKMDDPNSLQTVDYTEENPNNYSKSFMYRICQLPEVDSALFNSYSKISDYRIIRKDNKEIPKLSLQYEFCTDTNDIFFTKKFLELQECIRELTPAESSLTDQTFSKTVLVSDWVNVGGPKTINATIEPPYVAIAGEGVYYKGYEVYNSALVGATLLSYSIASDVAGYNNTVTFDNNYTYTDPITHQSVTTARFYGTIYTTNGSASKTATISYQQDVGQQYWVYSGSQYIGGLVNQSVKNIRMSISGITLGVNDESRCLFNSENGTFDIYIKTFTQPTGNVTVTILYDVVLSEGTYVSNATRIYYADKSQYNWRQPSLTGATYKSDAYLSILNNNHVVLNNVPADKAYYICDSDNNILVGMVNTTGFYLNILRSRDYNIYDSNGNIINHI